MVSGEVGRQVFDDSRKAAQPFAQVRCFINRIDKDFGPFRDFCVRG